MGKIFTLTQDIKDIAQSAIDDLIDQLGKICRVFYPAKATVCSNCIPDVIGNKSSNIWRTGGPMPFSSGLCPMCEGTGKFFEEKFTDIKFLCNWNPREWITGAGNIRIPDGYVQIKGYMTDLPKVMQSEYIIVEYSIRNYNIYKYKLVGEPIDQGNIIQERYFVALLKRIAE